MSREAIRICNGIPLALPAIPLLDLGTWRNWVLQKCGGAPAPVLPVSPSTPGVQPAAIPPRESQRGRLAALFGWPQPEGLRLFALVAFEHKGELRISSTCLPDGQRNYPALTPEMPEAHWFERELAELHNVVPEGHPWLKPLRRLEGIPFYRVEGESIHEVAVGPVHAGVIEPGHFRFQCFGEKVFHLEIQLGYQQRGIEPLMLKASSARRLALAESMAGDTVIGHSLTYCHAMEGLSNSSAPREAERIRAIALELERLANHVGDLGALANDVGFLPVSSYFGRLRAVFLNLLMALCGNRYGRNLLTPGGVRNGLTPELIPLFDAQLTDGRRDLEEIADLLFSTASAMARFEGTGIVRPETAQGLGLVGPAARASHLVRDVRRDFPFGLFREIPWKPVRCTSGDVHARARVRFLECRKSLEFLAEQTGILRHEPLRTPVGALAVNSLVISLTEGWRGEIVHAAATNAKGDLAFYKVVDPSFHNWMGLAMALRNGQISDFPLCNKSFNLSYAGHDL